MNKIEILDFDILTSNLDTLDIKNIKTINTINPHSYCVSLEDKEFENALKDSDVILPDGIGVVMAARVLKGIQIKRIAGYDLFLYLVNSLNRSQGSCFFLGSSNETLEKIFKRLRMEYPNIRVSGFSPPFKPSFTNEENSKMINQINSFKPDVIFVGMTAPKQEKWVYKNKKFINYGTLCSVGAVFDFYAGNIPRAPKIMILLGMEWVYRSLKSLRLAKRNIISNPKFIYYVFKRKLTQ